MERGKRDGMRATGRTRRGKGGSLAGGVGPLSLSVRGNPFIIATGKLHGRKGDVPTASPNIKEDSSERGSREMNEGKEDGEAAGGGSDRKSEVAS